MCVCVCVGGWGGGEGLEVVQKMARKPFPFSVLVTWSFSFVHSVVVDDSTLARYI